MFLLGFLCQPSWLGAKRIRLPELMSEIRSDPFHLHTRAKPFFIIFFPTSLCLQRSFLTQVNRIPKYFFVSSPFGKDLSQVKDIPDKQKRILLSRRMKTFTRWWQTIFEVITRLTRKFFSTFVLLTFSLSFFFFTFTFLQSEWLKRNQFLASPRPIRGQRETSTERTSLGV